LRDIKIILLTSYDANDAHIRDLPPSVSVVQKDKGFTETIGSILIEMGLFGTFEDRA